VTNSLVPSANVVVDDAAGALLIHRTDNDNWAGLHLYSRGVLGANQSATEKSLEIIV
jgi:hypothetical protein